MHVSNGNTFFAEERYSRGIAPLQESRQKINSQIILLAAYK
jgi:hypothetical protein